MRRRTIAITLALSAFVPLVAAPAAPAATSKAPKITRVSPMRLVVGQKVTISGRRFSSIRRRNTVVFRAPNGRSAFAKPRRASRRKLVVRVPVAVARILQGHKLMRFKLRVLVRRKFSKWTPRRLSPVVLSGSGAGGGVGGGAACTDDGDLLSRSLELQLGTDPCLRDTDGDGVDDGFEEQSAIDLNHYPRTPPLPYPGKRPYPNALDPTDGTTDYDGDDMQLREEFLMWVRFSADGVGRSGYPATLSNLLYSDGLQKSIDPAPPAPADPLARWALDLDDNGELWDDERDADGDGLSNWDEAHGQMTEAWWPLWHDGDNEPKESPYPEINFLDNADLKLHDAFAVSDLDGDGVLDGNDDNDHDGLTNQFEVRRPGLCVTPGGWCEDAFNTTAPTLTSPFAGDNKWAYTNPFNPCKPFNTERCHLHPPIGYYDGDGVPPIGDPPPAGFPGTHPARPQDGD